MSRIDESRPFIPLNIAVLTVSDTRKLEDDRSGNTLSERVAKAGHVLADRKIVTDDIAAIQRALDIASDPGGRFGIADDLPDNVDRMLVAAILPMLRNDFAIHIRDEEQGLFPLLCKRCGPDDNF